MINKPYTISCRVHVPMKNVNTPLREIGIYVIYSKNTAYNMLSSIWFPFHARACMSMYNGVDHILKSSHIMQSSTSYSKKKVFHFTDYFFLFFFLFSFFILEWIFLNVSASGWLTGNPVNHPCIVQYVIIGGATFIKHGNSPRQIQT